jgi:hypothetical protein
MADGAEAIDIEALADISALPASEWNALANPPSRPANPFVSHELLAALEASGSVGPSTGWEPAHIVMRRGGKLAGAAPLYVKSHGFGEYVFDHHWAEAYERHGGRYYPKLLCAPPFSPVTGPRLLVRDSADRAPLAAALVAAARRSGVSSFHANFLTAEDETALLEAGALPRRGVQYHWFNRGYRDFDDYLDSFSSRKRKQARRERRASLADGLVIRRLIGEAVTPQLWDAFWEFYQDTGSRKWGRPYLTRDFFRRLAAAMTDRVLLIVAERDGRPIAGALNLIGGDALYGRYWGAVERCEFLHFEVCYHQAIEFAIERGLARVEAGAQGEHKLARGYEPVEIRSAHWIADREFRVAIDAYLRRERTEISAAIAELAQATPFRKTTR